MAYLTYAILALRIHRESNLGGMLDCCDLRLYRKVCTTKGATHFLVFFYGAKKTLKFSASKIRKIY